MKFASFCVAFRNVNWNGKYNGCGAPSQHQCMSTYAKFCTGPTASIFATACLQAELGACLWNTTEGLSLAVRVGGYNDGCRCFPHFMCIFFSFLVYGAVNCFIAGLLFWAQLCLLVCFRSCSVCFSHCDSPIRLPGWQNPSAPFPSSPQLPLLAPPET